MTNGFGFSAAQVAGIADLVRGHVDPAAAEVTLSSTSGGQSNPTFFLHWDGGEAVLRKQPDGEIAPLAHAIDREYRLLQALQASNVPVPRPFVFYASRDLLGTPFYIMEKVEGRVFYDAALPGVSAGDRAEMYDSMAVALARLHTFDWREAGLEDFGRSSGFYARQLRLWQRFWSQRQGPENRDLAAVLAWVEAQSLPDEDAVIVHGDYRFANVMFAPDGPRVVAILDWELATIGPCASDLAFSATCYETGPDENGGLEGVNRPELGIPDFADYERAYWKARGVERRLTRFERVFALFRAAMGSETIAARGGSGQGTGADSAAFGARMGLAYARGAMRLIRGEG